MGLRLRSLRVWRSSVIRFRAEDPSLLLKDTEGTTNLCDQLATHHVREPLSSESSEGVTLRTSSRTLMMPALQVRMPTLPLTIIIPLK